MSQTLTLSQISKLVNGHILSGNPEASFSGLGSLKEATASDVSFLGNPKYLPDFESTDAGAVLITADITTGPENAALIVVENPTLAFGKIIDQYKASLSKPSPGVSPGAHIDPSAHIGENCSIAPGVVIEANVTIGDLCILGPGAVISVNSQLGTQCHIHANATITQSCVLGDHVTIHSGTVVGSDGFGYELKDGALEKIDQVGNVVIEDHVEIGSNCTIDRARFGSTIIGKGTKIDNLVQVGHNVRIGQHCILVAQSGIAGSTTLGNYVTIAAKAGVAGHLTVGDQFTLTGRGGLLKDAPAGEVWMGQPARPIRQELKAKAQINKISLILKRLKALEETES